MNKQEPRMYTPDDVKVITEAYQHIFGPIGTDLREYWDLDRKRAWGCLTTDFNIATYEQYEEASRRAIEIEATISDPRDRGCALREVTRKCGVGLSLGVCPWMDHGLFQTYERNKHKGRLTIILGHDWYPIVPLRNKKPHPVDVPLLRKEGLLGEQKYKNVRAIPPAIMNGTELLLFLNFKPDFRPPNAPVTGPFNPYPGYSEDCREGFNALVETVSRNNFKVQVISWGAAVWESLRTQVNGWASLCEQLKEAQKAIGVLAIAKEKPGSFLELCCGKQNVRYLPLAHPCDRRNFDKQHAEHANNGFREMGLGGSATPI